ncbi:hydrogenobyrinic acid a,c-diamide synthase (glutamine-hydrolysing) /cobyrinate a,c-diamide synthase [Chelatococcus asaccharovorans]|uniref:Hydrogenobyrinate a,c-diamide synthase n=2 Tax=Chelatococcus asaccharovorans TaxID=28210 RepID=A0A2V3U1J6_9HYPH|nr:hydrogenobyrinic acid a,c-diamide synthase (glutamine-hydrolysing) /cobyrinate a,c-diamide synthase [Chelatococcus asaccharovorans]
MTVPAMPPGLLVAAPRSGAGKTTVTLGLMRALARRGLRVAPVKCGPDYIDPAFHAVAAGRGGVNLDSWAMGAGLLDALIAGQSADADLVLGEGLMGLFDGVPGEPGRTGSSADIAALVGWPVLLVLDISGQSQSAAAMALGAARYDPRITIGGVILNKVGSERHRRLAAEAIEAVGLPVLGALPRGAVTLPERHLGLVQARETAELETQLEALADLVEAHVDIAAVQALARSGPRVAAPEGLRVAVPPPGQRIAIADDAAFSFVYPHIAMGWRAAGAELVPFSPLADEAPGDDCDVCWLPGGYPELHAGRLGANGHFRAGLAAFAATRPVHGECGGYMVLGEALVDAEGVSHPMAGLLPLVTSFAKRKLNLGYRIATFTAPTPFAPAGAVARGHEFHYASILSPPAPAPLAEVGDAYGNRLAPAGHRVGHVSGSFFHIIEVVT